MTIDQHTETDQVLAGAELDLDRVLAFAGQIAQNHAHREQRRPDLPRGPARSLADPRVRRGR